MGIYSPPSAAPSPQPNVFNPEDYGFAAWTYDPILPVTGTVLTNGALYLSRVQIHKAVTVSEVHWWVTTAGVTPTAGQNAIGLYDSSGALLASANVDADISSQGTKITPIFGSTTLEDTANWYWVGFLFNAATAPALARVTSLLSAHFVGTNAQRRFAQNGAGLTALPAPFVPSSNTGAGFAGPWAALR